MIFASVVASSLAVVAADDSLSSFVNAVPKCSLSAFKAALDKQSCDTKNVGPATFDCLCKQVTNISEDMALSVAASELDSDCLASEFHVLSMLPTGSILLNYLSIQTGLPPSLVSAPFGPLPARLQVIIRRRPRPLAPS